MEILNTYSSTPSHLYASVIAIGNFDGVHLGHKAVLEQTKSIAQNLNKPSGVMVFEPHPRSYFAPDKPFFHLTDLNMKLKLLAEQRLDMAVVLPFDDTLANLTAEEFVKVILVSGLKVSHVIVGYDFHFGKGRQGTPESLKQLGAQCDFGVSIVAPQTDGHEVFSSSRIRGLLAEGNVREAANVLGHSWRVAGRVIDGAKRGTYLGFPTANIELKSYQPLKYGIYAVHVYKERQMYFGAAYIGTRPTFDNGPAILEVFLFDFSGDLYTQEIEVEFVEYIRGDQKFDDAEALKAQIRRDCQQAEEILQKFALQKSAV